jgi:hypothetical protein
MVAFYSSGASSMQKFYGPPAMRGGIEGKTQPQKPRLGHPEKKESTHRNSIQEPK